MVDFIMQMKNSFQEQIKKLNENQSNSEVPCLVEEIKKQIRIHLEKLDEMVNENFSHLRDTDHTLDVLIKDNSRRINEIIELNKQMILKINSISDEVKNNQGLNSLKLKFDFLEEDMIKIKEKFKEQNFYVQRIDMASNQRIEVWDEIILKIQRNYIKINKYFDEYQKKCYNQIDEFQNIIEKEIMPNVEKKINEIKEYTQEFVNTFHEFKAKQNNIYVNQNDFDDLKQKLINFKSKTKKQIQILVENINNEKEKFHEFVRTYHELIGEMKVMQDTIKMKSSSTEENLDNNINESYDFNEMKVRISRIENNQEQIVQLDENQKQLEELINFQKEEFLDQIGNLQYVITLEHEEIEDKVKSIEEKVEQGYREILDCPLMITKTIEDNQIMLHEFEDKINNLKIDLKTNIGQIKLADEELDELKRKMEESEEISNKIIENISIIIENHKKDTEIIFNEENKINEIVNALKTEVDIQANKTNVHFNNVLNRLRKKVNKLKKLITKNEADSNSETEVDEPINVDIKGILDVACERIQRIEENMRINTDKISTYLKIGENLMMYEEKLQHQFQSERKNLNHRIQDMFLSNDEYLSLKKEVQTLHRVLNAFIENSKEEKEKFEEDMNKIINRMENSFFFADTTEDKEKTHFPPSISYEEINIKIESIELSFQRQIRKLHKNIRKIQKTIAETEEVPHHHKHEKEEEKEPQNIVKEQTSQLPISKALSELKQSDYELLLVLLFTTLFYFLLADLLI